MSCAASFTASFVMQRTLAAPTVTPPSPPNTTVAPRHWNRQHATTGSPSAPTPLRSTARRLSHHDPSLASRHYPRRRILRPLPRGDHLARGQGVAYRAQDP